MLCSYKLPTKITLFMPRVAMFSLLSRLSHLPQYQSISCIDGSHHVASQVFIYVESLSNPVELRGDPLRSLCDFNARDDASDTPSNVAHTNVSADIPSQTPITPD